MAEQIFHAEVTGLAVGGEAVGTATSGGPSTEGKRVFLTQGIPGEQVTFVVSEQKGSFLRGEVTTVEAESPSRVKPPCPYFGRCGGCDFQYFAPPALRAEKLRMIESMLRRQAKLELSVKLLGEELPHFNYRRRVTLQLAHQGGKTLIGFFRKKSGEVQDVASCLLLRPLLEAALQELRSAAHEIPSFVGKLVLEEHLGGVFMELKLSETRQPGKLSLIEEALRPFLARFPRVKVSCEERELFSNYAEDPEIALGHFSQVNEEANQILQNTIVSLVQGSSVTDLYAGAGNLSFPLVASGKRITAVEVNPALVRKGRTYAEKIGATSKISFVEASCEQYCKTGPLTGTVLLDPPRSGALAIVESFSPEITREIIYVSCSLPTLARDLKVLTEKGYRVKESYFLDMFPQTHHVETITYLCM